MSVSTLIIEFERQTKFSFVYSKLTVLFVGELFLQENENNRLENLLFLFCTLKLIIIKYRAVPARQFFVFKPFAHLNIANFNEIATNLTSGFDKKK